MKINALAFLFLALPLSVFAQHTAEETPTKYIEKIPSLTMPAAQHLLSNANKKAETLGKTATIVILDASGEILLAARGKNVGPHNTEAARRKAYTSLSTKTGTFELMKAAQNNPNSENLNTLPELLLLSGGNPIYWQGNVIGSIGVAGGGSAENDDVIAKAAEIPTEGITTNNIKN